MNWYVALGIVVVSGLVGYFVGAARFFRESKQKAYVAILPPILKWAYNIIGDRRTQIENAIEYNEAMHKLWLFAEKDVARKMDHAVWIAHDPKKRSKEGEMTKAFQITIAAMRNDIQIWPWQRMKPEEFKHIQSM